MNETTARLSSGQRLRHLLRDLVPLLADDNHMRARYQLETVERSESGFPLAHRALLTDPRVASAFDFRRYWLRHVVRELEEIATEARRIVALVDAELG